MSTRNGTVRVCAAFCRDEHGGLAMITGLLVVPIFLMAGIALDYTRALSVRQQLQNAADAAALAAKGDPENAAAAAEQAAQAYANANIGPLNGATLAPASVVPTSDGYEVTLTASMPTSLSRAVGFETWDVQAVSESVRASNPLEIALVLDNTGSMAGHMDELKSGARDLVNAVFGSQSSSSRIKFAVVPYVGTVNIGNGATQRAWMDTNADAQWHGHGLEYWNIGYQPGCALGGGGGPIDPGIGEQGFLYDMAKRFAGLVQDLLGIGTARAASAADVPSPYIFTPDCWASNPAKLNMFDYFDRIPNTAWKGCVMARPDTRDLDVSDEAPNPGDPDTLFVPWFWPDTLDASAIAASGYGVDTKNDYLPDRLDLRDAMFPVFNDAWVGWGHWNMLKYNGTFASIDETGPDTLGPNKACPDPILPLSNTKSTVIDKIDSLSHWNGSGTNTAEGIAWGMRVLTPGAPFTQGSTDPKARRVLVLMTDGVNNIDPSSDTSLNSEWSTYGNLGQGRVLPPTYDGFRSHANTRMQRACEIAKSKNIDIYTVAFNVSDEATLALLRDCASQPPYAYSASTAQEMVEAFGAIGRSLTELRLSR